MINGQSVKLDQVLFGKIINGTAGAPLLTSQVQSISLSPAQQDKLLREMLWGAAQVWIDPFDTSMTATLTTAGAIGYSVERVQLLDAYYNAKTLIGSGVRDAIASDLRAALWFEIR